MSHSPRRARLSLAIAAALGVSCAAEAVYLNPDGLGQALIYPYYTVRSVKGNAFNTLLSVVNHTPEAKVVRVRFLEGRNARAVQGFNLYLSPNDVWTGAIVPLGADGTRVISADTSCTNGLFDNVELGAPGRTFQNIFYTGDNFDGFEAGLDRTREGYIEMLEMATLTGASAAAVTHRATGVPFDCAAVQGTPVLQLGAPSGGLSGSLTLINVNNGSDFTVNAEALADLTTQPFYRPPADPYPGFDALEVTPVSLITDSGQIYRSIWPRGVDAVSAVLTRNPIAEYVLDGATRSRTDLVTTFPTRHFYVTGSRGSPPFFSPTGRMKFEGAYLNREGRGALFPFCEVVGLPCAPEWAGAANVFTVTNGAVHMDSIGVLGSKSNPVVDDGAPQPRSNPTIAVTPTFTSGWLWTAPIPGEAQLTSLPGSTRMDMATGQVVTSTHLIRGLPVVGFALRTFENGTLACSAGSCQGNYGGSFPFKYRRNIVPAN